MTEHEWLESADPQRMLLRAFEHLRAEQVGIGGGWRQPVYQTRPQHMASDRKLRLFVEACISSCTCDKNFTESNSADVWARRGDINECHCTRAYRAALLREVIGNPFRPMTLPTVRPLCPYCQSQRWTAIDVDVMACSECYMRFRWDKGWLKCPWLTPTVLALATAAYEERAGLEKVWSEIPVQFATSRYEPLHTGILDPQRLAVLADALEEAGCGDVECPECKGDRRSTDTGLYPCPDCHGTGRIPNPLLAHLRSPGPHVRGCWALDLILGFS